MGGACQGAGIMTCGGGDGGRGPESKAAGPAGRVESLDGRPRGGGVRAALGAAQATVSRPLSIRPRPAVGLDRIRALHGVAGAAPLARAVAAATANRRRAILRQTEAGAPDPR